MNGRFRRAQKIRLKPILLHAFFHCSGYPMFNTRLKQELSALREEISSLQQVRESPDSEMLVLSLGADGRIETANHNFTQQMHYTGTALLGLHIDELVPAHLKTTNTAFACTLGEAQHYENAVCRRLLARQWPGSVAALDHAADSGLQRAGAAHFDFLQ